MNITESIKFNKLQAENETLLKELAEKNKEIALLKIRIINDNEGSCEMFEQGHKLQKENEELKQQQLYKEDIDTANYQLNDASKYDKLPSKEDK